MPSTLFIITAAILGWTSGAFAWMYGSSGKRGMGILVISLLNVSQISIILGKGDINGEFFSRQFMLRIAAYIGANFISALLAFYAIRSSERLQRMYRLRPRSPIRFSMSALLLLMTFVALASALVAIYRQ